MITLVTGGPGTGKTAWLLRELKLIRLIDRDREIYIHGVRNLRGLAHEQIFCNSQLCDVCRSQDIPAGAKYVEDWPTWKRAGALIVVDEVQRIWRPRVGSAAVPSSVSGLETHRHYGLDFWLISQGPHLFDNFIRLLVGRHVHLVAKWSGRMQYEWPECKQDVQSRSDAVVRSYSLPKDVFSMYDSAEIHTKQDKRRPLSFYAMIGAIVLATLLIGLASKRIYDRIHPEPIFKPAANPATPNAPTGGVGMATAVAPTFPDYHPTIPGVPESAPAYFPILKVRNAPVLIGCVKTPDFCRCYSKQAVPYPATQAFCESYLRGEYFNPYRGASGVGPEQAEGGL